MYSSQYDGGAFSSSQSTQSPDSSISKSRVNLSATVPLTVKQITDAYESSSEKKSTLIIDGVEVDNIVLVGMVCNKASRATDATFTLDDGTGRMDFIRWVNDASDASETAIIENGMYVSIVGSFKGFSERKRATAFAIRPVKDNNQIVLHFIQCVRMHLENTKSKVGSLTQPQQSLVNRSSLSSGSPQTPVSTKASGNSTAVGSETDIYKLVLDVFQEPLSVASEHGIHVDEVVQRLGLPANKIKEAIDYHVDVGHIYSTIDDFHFKSACID
ncbi:replication protein A subunit A-like protein [Carex littledalei]|uniref:Replication protein A subunit A-like protein n=1 Tax=Carex littledalei TaxID=544730 RepID=A0A833VHX8_9POAL|nr:replication protein A subunit A-like protein [Carex littledalei]